MAGGHSNSTQTPIYDAITDVALGKGFAEKQREKINKSEKKSKKKN